MAKRASRHQVTIPASALSEGEVREGDTLEVEVQGSRCVLVTKVDEVVDGYAGSLATGGALRRTMERLRNEWR